MVYTPLIFSFLLCTQWTFLFLFYGWGNRLSECLDLFLLLSQDTLGWEIHKQQKWIAYNSAGWQVRDQADLASGEGLLCLRGASFSVCLQMAEGRAALLAHPSAPRLYWRWSHSRRQSILALLPPRLHLFFPVTWEFKFQNMNLCTRELRLWRW